ncbi:MAG: pilin [Patescibacteria group bacterium]|nr:pilin [Patescibacteria group bacterium]
MDILFVPIFGTIDPKYLTGNYTAGGSGLSYLISNFINVVIIVSGIAFFLYLALGGLRYITAGGDAKQTQEAMKQITNAVIGLAIVVGAFAITRIVGTVLGIDIFKPVFRGP